MTAILFFETSGTVTLLRNVTTQKIIIIIISTNAVEISNIISKEEYIFNLG
jgi:hypothetical protein